MEKIKLFCLPYAGGSAMVYSRWKKSLDNSIELCPIELKGRGKRFNESFYDSIDAAIEDIYSMIKMEIDNCQYAFFGHSMGTVLVYELLNKIRALKHQEPVHIFFSGRYPPHMNKDEKILHTLPDDEFKEEIFKYGGTPKEFMENKELLEIFLPILRADYKILESHQSQMLKEVFDFNITILNGRDDDEVEASDLEGWKEYTGKECKIYEYDGGHFFINDYTEEIVKIINATLMNKNDDHLLSKYSALFE